MRRRVATGVARFDRNVSLGLTGLSLSQNRLSGVSIK